MKIQVGKYFLYGKGMKFLNYIINGFYIFTNLPFDNFI
jgi:hypothetical protein